MSAEEDSTSSPDEDPYDDTDILNSAGTDEVTAHLAAAGIEHLAVQSWQDLIDKKRAGTSRTTKWHFGCIDIIYYEQSVIEVSPFCRLKTNKTFLLIFGDGFVFFSLFCIFDTFN